MRLLTVELHEENGRDQVIPASGEEDVQLLDRMIRALVRTREDVIPEIPQDFPPDSEKKRFPAVDSPWKLGKMQGDDSFALSHFHPGIGWLHFHMERSSAEELLDRLESELRPKS